MRILWVKAGKILPVNTGGRIRSYNILKHLATRNEVIFLSYYPGARDEEYERDLARPFPGSVAFAAGAPSARFAQALHYGTRLPTTAPYSVEKFTDRAVRRSIRALISDRCPDVAVCDFLSPSLNFPDPLPIPSVLFQHNVEHVLWDRQARHEANPGKRLAFAIEAAKMRRYERRMVRRFHHVVAVSENDRALMSDMTAPSRITVVPTGVDTSAYRLDASIGQEHRRVMFLGSMDWPANIDGVELFCEQIWPRVVEAVPDARFQVVGRNPPPRIQRLASDSVEIVGGVESVVPYLRGAPVFVVPLRIGGGTRLKIYEAMAAERAIVSTTVGAEGLDHTDGRDLIIADEPQRFADAVIRLLCDPAARMALGSEAGATAARFDWSSVAREFENVLMRTISGGRVSTDVVHRPARSTAR
ncbi:MAG: glycosyltransferase [Gemmatimonadaceae bacterium]